MKTKERTDQPDGWDSYKNEKDKSDLARLWTSADIHNVLNELDILRGKIKCLEELESLHEQQIGVLKQFIESYLMINIKPDGSHHGRK